MRLRAAAGLLVALAAAGCGDRAHRLCTLPGGVSCVAVAGGDLWIGHKTDGLYRCPLAGGKPELMTDPRVRREVRTIAVDGDTLWLATNAGVVTFSIRDRKVMRAWTPREGLGGDSVRCVSVARGQVWAGTIFGASRLLPGGARWKNYQVAQGLPQNHVYRLADDGRVLWASCINGGIARYDARADRWAAVPQVNGIGNKFVYAMEADPADGALWLGSAGGVNRYDPAKGYDVAVCDTGYTDYSVYAIHRAGGVLWFGTTYGLYRRNLATGRQQVLGAGAGLPGEDVVALAAAPGALLVATRGGVASLSLPK